MAYAPFPPDDGTEPSPATRDADARASDETQIAADRQDIEDDGSLKDTLADVVANGTQDEIERLTDRIGAAQASYSAPDKESSSLPLLAESANQGSATEPDASTLLGLRDWSETHAAVAAELVEIQSQPLLPQSEQQQHEGGTHWHPVQEQDVEPYHPEEQKEREDPAAHSSDVVAIDETSRPKPLVGEALVTETEVPETPAAEPLQADLSSEASGSDQQPPEPAGDQSPESMPGVRVASSALAGLSSAELARPQSLHARLEASLPQELVPDSSRPQSLSARLETPLPEPSQQESQKAAPIASALDAANKLVADADAAAAALENLSRMLQAHQRPASMIPSPGQHAALRPLHPSARSSMPDSRPGPMPPRSVMPDGDPLQMPTPRPEHRPVQRVMRPAPAEVPPARPVRPPTLRPAPVPRDARFDLRGFMAGFAVAGAIGALLYIYLLTG
jgi:hypothetical protein